MKIDSPNKAKPALFPVAAKMWLGEQARAFFSTLNGREAMVLMAHARDRWLLPTEGFESLDPQDLYGVSIATFAMRIKTGILTERAAKLAIAAKVEAETKALRTLMISVPMDDRTA